MSTIETTVTCPYCARKNTPSGISSSQNSRYCHEEHLCEGRCAHCLTRWSFTRMGAFEPTPASASHNIPNCNLEYERKLDSAREDISILTTRINAMEHRILGDAPPRYGSLLDRIQALEIAEDKRAREKIERCLAGSPLSGKDRRYG